MSSFARSETANLVPLRLERSESAASLEYFLAGATLLSTFPLKPKTPKSAKNRPYLTIQAVFCLTHALNTLQKTNAKNKNQTDLINCWYYYNNFLYYYKIHSSSNHCSPVLKFLLPVMPPYLHRNYFH